MMADVHHHPLAHGTTSGWAEDPPDYAPPLDGADAMRLGRMMVSHRYPRTQECTICLGSMRHRPAILYPCGHSVHLFCDKRLRASRCPTLHLCPVCRAPLGRPESTSETSEA